MMANRVYLMYSFLTNEYVVTRVDRIHFNEDTSLTTSIEVRQLFSVPDFDLVPVLWWERELTAQAQEITMYELNSESIPRITILPTDYKILGMMTSEPWQRRALFTPMQWHSKNSILTPGISLLVF